MVRNWVDLSHIYPMSDVSPYRAELGFADQDFVILYSGNIGAKQGLNVLLDAAERLDGDRDIHFVIAGEGPNKGDLKARYGHLKNVRFLPFQPYARLNEFLNMPDLHVLPQEPDAADLVLPSKLGGMLASGKRVLVTANEETELAEFLGEASIIIPPGNAELMAARVRSARDEVDSSHEMRIERATLLAKDTGMARLVANIT